MAADRVVDRSVITTKAPTCVGAFFFAFQNVHDTAHWRMPDGQEAQSGESTSAAVETAGMLPAPW